MYDFPALKLIPIASYLKRKGKEVRKRSATELAGKCPLPSHLESEHKNGKNETFCISVEKNLAFCHSTRCREIGNHPKGLDVLDVVCRIENCDVKTAAKILTEMFCIGNGATAPPSKLSESSGNKPLSWKHEHLDPDHPMIRERGISLETAMEFGIGYHPGSGEMKGRIAFPIFEDGHLIGYVGRLVEGEGEKWHLAKGTQRTFLYGLEKVDPSKPVILAESFWAPLWFYQKGVQCVALGAASMTDAQERRLDPFKEITVAMDDDPTGREAADRIVARLKPKHKVLKAFLRE